jgi:hypothetical protein
MGKAEKRRIRDKHPGTATLLHKCISINYIKLIFLLDQYWGNYDHSAYTQGAAQAAHIDTVKSKTNRICTF